MKAIIPAAGLGTRFLPATKGVPKELLPLLDTPVIQHVVEEALDVEGVDAAIIVNSHEKPMLEAYFSPAPALQDFLVAHGKEPLAKKVEEAGALPVAFVYQDEPLGLGHAVLQAAPEVGDEPFFVLLGDYVVPAHGMNPAMAAVSAAHGGASVIAVAPVDPETTGRWGIIAGELVEGEDVNAPGAVLKLSGLVEKPAPEEAPTNLAIVGRYLLSPRVMELLEDQGTGAGGEIQLTDALVRLLAEEEMYALVVDGRDGLDTGTPATWAAANARMALADAASREAFFEELGDDAALMAQ